MSHTSAIRTPERCAHCRETVASITYDVNSFITVVGGYVELFLAGKLGDINPQQQRVLKEIRGYIDGLHDYAKRLLEISKTQVDEADLELRDNNLKACVEELLQLWASTFESKNIANYFIPSEVPNFPFDYKRIQQVISKLLENALRFTPSGGTITVVIEPYVWRRHEAKKSEQDVKIFSTSNSIRITVIDTATGSSPEYQQEVFEGLWQAEVSPSNNSVGSGLAFARRLVQLHGGRMWVESEPGVENRFCVLLPLPNEGKQSCAELQ